MGSAKTGIYLLLLNRPGGVQNGIPVKIGTCTDS